jgi:hypothetical protein
MDISIRPNSPFFMKNKKILENIGLSAVIVFNDSGLPIYLKSYTGTDIEKVNESEQDSENLVFSAFISSLSNFTKMYQNEELKGFSSGGLNYYIKIKSEIIYCLVLNSNIFQLANGEKLPLILDRTLEILIRSFSVYYSMTKTKDFIEKNFLENFQYQLDTTLLFNLQNEARFINSNKGKINTEISIKEKINEYFSDTFHHIFLSQGILGLFILNAENKPIIIRDYVINQKFVKSLDFYQSIALTIRQFGRNNLGLTDFGIGENRIIIKYDQNSNTIICLIISENTYWYHNFKSISTFSSSLTHNLHTIISKMPKFVYNFENNSIQSEQGHSTNYLVDNLLHTNLIKVKKNRAIN